MRDSVDTKGFDEAEAKLASAPARLRRALYDGTKEAVALIADVLRANTPVHVGRTPVRKGAPYPPGALLAGWRTKVAETAGGAEGKVYNRVYYRLFVERGAHPHRPMRAQPITAKGVAETSGAVTAIYEARVAVAVTEIE